MHETLKNNVGTTVAFGDVVQLATTSSKNPAADGFDRYVGLEHMQTSDLRIRNWGDIADGTTFTRVFKPGQVLFGKRRAYQRKVAVAEFSGVCSGDIYVLEPKGDELLPELLPFICQRESFYDYVISMSQGGLSPRVNWKALAKYEFTLPSLEEQRRIVDVLQAAEAFKEKRLSLQRHLLSVLDSVAFHAMRSQPCDHSLAEYCEINPQRLTKLQLASDEVWSYADLSTVSFPLKVAGMQVVRLSEAPSRARRIAIAGDILVSTVRPNLKGHAILSGLDSPIIASTGFTVLRPKRACHRYMIMGLLLSSRFLQHCEGRVTGTAYPAVRPKDVSSFSVPNLKQLEQGDYGPTFELLLKAVGEWWAKTESTVDRLYKTLSKKVMLT